MNLKGCFFNIDTVIQLLEWALFIWKLAWNLGYLPWERKREYMSEKEKRREEKVFIYSWEKKKTPNISMGYLLDSVFI